MSGYEYSVQALTAAHESFRDLIDSKAGAGAVVIKDAMGTVLSTIALDEPSGTVDVATGGLTMIPDGRDEAAAESGTAHLAEIVDGDGVAHLSLPCQQGTTPTPGYAVLTSLEITQGDPVELALMQIG